MRIENWLGGQSAEDVQATMLEEGCDACFGCPYATVFAATISRAADSTYEAVARVSDLTHGNITSSEEREKQIANITASGEELQKEYREKLGALTTACAGWFDGNGLDVAPRPVDMCNSPKSGDSRISIAAGWILEKISLGRYRS